MSTDKNKVVQQYCLQELRQVWPDKSQLWSARHKILKKCFTLKRVKYSSAIPSKPEPERTHPAPSNDEYDRLMRITNDLKRLNLSCVPKCHKMIKTSCNLYVVYDEFPKSTLQSCLQSKKTTLLQKWQLLGQLLRVVQEVHAKDYALIGLNPQNVYVKDDQSIMLGDWRLAKNIAKKETLEENSITYECRYISEEVKELGVCGFWADVYSLGMIFADLAQQGLFQGSNLMKKKLKEVTLKMLAKDVHERPTLDSLVAIFVGKKEEEKERKTLKSARSFQLQPTSSILTQQTKKLQHLGSFREKPLGDTTCTRLHDRNHTQNHIHEESGIHTLQIPSPTSLRIKTSKTITEVSTPTTRKTSNRLSFQPNLSSMRTSKNSDRSPNKAKEPYIDACRQRNLSFLLLDLSEFVVRMQICPDLAYLLLKKSLIILKAAIQTLIALNNRDYQNQKLVTILKQEYTRINDSMLLLKESLGAQAGRDDHLRREFTEDRINEQYLVDKIVEFGRGMVVQCEKKSGGGICVSKLSEVLFKTYLILKKVEEGSYCRFWGRVCQSDYIFLGHQKYLKQEKSLGYRYLKSKIAEILSKRK